MKILHVINEYYLQLYVFMKHLWRALKFVLQVYIYNILHTSKSEHGPFNTYIILKIFFTINYHTTINYTRL